MVVTYYLKLFRTGADRHNKHFNVSSHSSRSDKTLVSTLVISVLKVFFIFSAYIFLLVVPFIFYRTTQKTLSQNQPYTTFRNLIIINRTMLKKAMLK